MMRWVIISVVLLGAVLAAQNLDLPYTPKRAVPDDEDLPEIVVYYGGSYEAETVVYAIDRSGSMNLERRWERQVREVARSIAELEGDASFDVVLFASDVRVFRGRPVEATGRNKAAALAFVRAEEPKGSTCIAGGAVRALRIARLSDARFRAVIVTSDGEPTICGTTTMATPEEESRIIDETVAANPGRAVRLHTVFTGKDNDQAEEFLEELAGAHGGTFRRAR